MIEVEHLTVRYNSAETAIEGLSLEVSPGEFVLVTGPSGCGKSTLARCLNGLIPHSSTATMTGRVTVDGLDTAEHAVAELAMHVGLVFQNPATQLFASTVAEEVSFGPRNLGFPAEEVAARSRFALEATGMEHLAERATRTLSLGEQQRVAIAAVLAMRPKVLVLDEPTSNLDLKGTQTVLETLGRLRDDYGLTIMIIEHRLSECVKLAGRAVVMDRGEIVLDGAPESVFSHRGLLSGLGIRFPRERADESWTGRWSQKSGRCRPEGRPLVELRGVRAGYNSAKVLRDLSLAVYPGEFVALVGDNGAGKTTLARLLAGLMRPTKGDVLWSDSVHGLPLGRRVGLLFQNPLNQLFCDTVEEDVAFGPCNFQIFSERRLETILNVAGLRDVRERAPYTLSVGQQQRVALAAVLALHPALLVLDEPTMGQDWGSLSRVMDFLGELNGHGQTILLITHDYKLVCRYAGRILSLEHGRVSELGPSGQALPETDSTKGTLYEVLSA
jgi:energy-coupling factor transporter ATP-binding protein EcfA2